MGIEDESDEPEFHGSVLVEVDRGQICFSLGQIRNQQISARTVFSLALYTLAVWAKL